MTASEKKELLSALKLIREECKNIKGIFPVTSARLHRRAGAAA